MTNISEVLWVAGVTAGMGVIPLLVSMYHRWLESRDQG